MMKNKHDIKFLIGSIIVLLGAIVWAFIVCVEILQIILNIVNDYSIDIVGAVVIMFAAGFYMKACTYTVSAMINYNIYKIKHYQSRVKSLIALAISTTTCLIAVLALYIDIPISPLLIIILTVILTVVLTRLSNTKQVLGAMILEDINNRQQKEQK